LSAVEAERAMEQPRVRSKIWVERGGEVLLSDWRVDLLEAVEETGSLAGGAAKLGVPYRTAWERVKETEGRVGMRLLETESGGAEGGGSRLTEEARDLIARFRRISAGVAELVERRFREELDGMLR
jgi:molybdate transport system regulatory protein